MSVAWLRAPASPATPPGSQPAGLSRRDRLRQWRPSRAAIVAGLVLLMLVSLALRTGTLHLYYWIDEGISVGIASHPLSSLPTLLREDGSPPLYYLLLHVWMQAFGRHEVATHLLSLVFSMIAVPTAYWSGASLWGRRAGAYCAVLAAGLPFLTTYAQETRMYSLLALLSLVVATSFVHSFVRHDWRYLPVFVVSLTAALYTHYWALFLGLMAFIAWLVCVRLSDERRPLWRDGAIAFGAIAVLYLPWLPTLAYQVQHTGAPWALPPTLRSLSQAVSDIAGGQGAGVALLLVGGSGLLAPKLSGQRERRSKIELVSLALLGLGALLVAWLYAKTTPAWAVRYLAVIIGPMLLLAGIGLSRASRMGVAALALVICFWVLNPPKSWLDAKSNLGSGARAVSAQTGSNAVVLSTQPEQVPALAFYLPKVTHFVTPLGPVPDPRVVDWRNALQRVAHNSTQSVLIPTLRSLRPGERIDLVVPVRLVRAPEWMNLIRLNSLSWSRYLEHDPHLRLLQSASPHPYSSGLPVRISVYEQLAGSAGSRR
ncbi:MAG: glycosyltransferase family 39 protein [Solirubrobacteraceae bacterium]